MNAVVGLLVEPRPLKIGIVKSTPNTPKVIIIGLRPILSDSAPTTGCNSMKTKIAAVVISVAVVFSKPEVLTKYFCKYVVKVLNASVPPAVSIITVNACFGYLVNKASALDFGPPFLACSCASFEDWVSTKPRRIQNTTMASTAPMKKGIRQPHSDNCASLMVRCKMINTHSAKS